MSLSERFVNEFKMKRKDRNRARSALSKNVEKRREGMLIRLFVLHTGIGYILSNETVITRNNHFTLKIWRDETSDLEI